MGQLLSGFTILPENAALRFAQAATTENPADSCVTTCKEHADFAINSVATVYGEDSPAVDLMKKMLTLDPETRFDAQQAMNHPFVQQFREKELQRKGKAAE